MSTHQQSNPWRAKKPMADESGRPGTCKSKVGCDAIEEPCTNRIVPIDLAGSPATFSHRKSFTPPSLPAQCSSPLTDTAEATVISFIRHLSKRSVFSAREGTIRAASHPCQMAVRIGKTGRGCSTRHLAIHDMLR